MVTGRAGDQNAVRGLDAGADDYIVKPLSITELLARIWALLEGHPRQDPTGAGPRAVAAAEAL